MIYLNDKWYYDPKMVELKPLMVIVYNDNILVIDSIDGNIITFKNPLNPGSITVRVYIPYQPFTYESIVIENNTIMNSNINGWIEYCRRIIWCS
jgi:hypothetical protein